MKALTLSLILAAGLLPQARASADTLLIERVETARGVALPARGQTMAQVESRFGAPQRRHAAVAGPGDAAHNPPITRWDYAGFSVYFEHSHVVNAVLAKAKPEEIGPKPVQ